MMNKLLLAAFTICLLASCGIPGHTHAKIDLADFNAKQVHDTARRLFKRNTEIIVVRLSDGSFLTKSTRAGIKLSGTGYYYPSGKLKTYTLTTHGFNYGKSPLYNESGDLISITDNDAPFKYSINRLDAKFAFGYGINIFSEGNEVTRSTDENHPLYRVTIPFNTPYGGKERHFVVDGMTGKTLSDETVTAARQEIPANN